MDEASLNEAVKVDPKEDARPLLDQVFNEVKDIKVPDVSPDDIAERDIGLSFARHTRALDLLKQATTRPCLSLPYKQMDAFRDNARIKKLAKILCFSARWEARQGHWPVARQYLLLSNQLSQWLGRGHGTLASLVQTAIDHIALGASLQIVHEAQGDPRSVDVARQLIEAVPPSFDLRNCYPYEVQLSLYLMRHPEQQGSMESLAFGDPRPEEPKKLTAEEEQMANLMMAHMVLAGIEQTKAVRSVTTFPEQFEALQKATRGYVETNKASDPGVLAGVDPGLLKIWRDSMVRREVARRIVRVAVWAFEQRRQKGSFLDRVPESLPMSDPKLFALKYVKEPDGFMVYWFGPDGEDNNGVDPHHSIGRARNSDDYGYRFKE